MHVIFGWKIKRSGASVTVTGTDANGQSTKLSGVKVVELLDGAVIATDDVGTKTRLALV